MNAKAFYYFIPDRRKPFNEQLFPEGYPNIFSHKIAASKMTRAQVLNLLNAFCVLRQSAVENVAWSCTQSKATFPRTGWNCLADIFPLRLRRAITAYGGKSPE
jgi:hypothetical protein